MGNKFCALRDVSTALSGKYRTGFLRALSALFTAVAFAGGAFVPASAQQKAAAPAPAASEAGISEQTRRQAASPYRWIIANQSAPQRARTAPAPEAAKAGPSSTAPPTATTPPVPAGAAAVSAAANRRADAAEAAARPPVATALPTAATPSTLPVAGTPASIQVAQPPSVSVPAPLQGATPPPSSIQAAPVTLPVAPITQLPVAPPPVQQLNTELVPLSQAEPRFSPAVLRDLAEGTSVKIAFTVNPDGGTANIKVVSSTDRRLNRPVMDAVREWKYKKIDIPQDVELDLVFK